MDNQNSQNTNLSGDALVVQKKKQVKNWIIGFALMFVGYLIVELVRWGGHVEQVSEQGVFPEAFKTGFLTSCVRDGGTDTQCQCAIRYYEQKYTYGEYLKVMSDQAVKNAMREACE